MHLTMIEMVYQDIQVTNNWNVKLKHNTTYVTKNKNKQKRNT